jgi:hypothetical protein
MLMPRAVGYLDLALLGRNEWWRYLAGAAIIALSWLGLGYVPYYLLLLVGLTAPPFDFVAVNLSIFTMLAGLAVTVKWIHHRSLRSLLTPDRVDWSRVVRAAAVWTVLAAATAWIEHVLHPGRYYLSFDAARFPLFFVLVMLLTPLQCAVEELVFRGYAMQGLGLLTRRPLAIAVASSLVFTAPHLLNPEVHEHGAAIMAANYFAIGMLLATIALRDGRLEMAIGLHAANNVFLALIANYQGSALMTESVFTARELDPVFSLVTLVAGALLFHGWMFRRNAPAPS